MNAVTISDPAFRTRYEALRTTWLDETAHQSWIDAKHPCAREILDLGPSVIVFLVEDFRTNDQWTWHLSVLLCELLDNGPKIPEDARGRLHAVRACWLRWMEEQGH